jgi:hypothetical protein
MTDKFEDEPVIDDAPVRLTDDEIKEFAKGILDGRLFTSYHISQREMADHRLFGMIFMPVGLGGLRHYNPEKIGAIVEWIDKAGPRSVNGYPIFFSCRVVHTDDWKRIVEIYERLNVVLTSELSQS